MNMKSERSPFVMTTAKRVSQSLMTLSIIVRQKFKYLQTAFCFPFYKGSYTHTQRRKDKSTILHKGWLLKLVHG